MNPEIVDGDLLEQKTDAIVNSWNRNIIPWWLLWPQGVSGAIKRRGGLAPFKELGRLGAIPLGQAVATGPGTLPFKNIIHVAGINMLWRSSPQTVSNSVRNAVGLAERMELRSLAFPIIGAGSGGLSPPVAEAAMLDTMRTIESTLEVVVVRYRPKTLS